MSSFDLTNKNPNNLIWIRFDQISLCWIIRTSLGRGGGPQVWHWLTDCQHHCSPVCSCWGGGGSGGAHNSLTPSPWCVCALLSARVTWTSPTVPVFLGPPRGSWARFRSSLGAGAWSSNRSACQTMMLIFFSHDGESFWGNSCRHFGDSVVLIWGENQLQFVLLFTSKPRKTESCRHYPHVCFLQRLSSRNKKEEDAPAGCDWGDEERRKLSRAMMRRRRGKHEQHWTNQHEIF